MNTPTFAKCRCNNCTAKIEFDDSQAGQLATCPNCGMETKLYIPDVTQSAMPAPKPIVLSDLTMRRKWIIASGIGLAVLVFVLYAARNFGSDTTLMATAGGVGMLGGLVLFVFAIFVCILWIVFPVFVYYGMRRIEALLRQIEINGRH